MAFYETLEVKAVMLQVDFCGADDELLKVRRSWWGFRLLLRYRCKQSCRAESSSRGKRAKLDLDKGIIC